MNLCKLIALLTVVVTSAKADEHSIENCKMFRGEAMKKPDATVRSCYPVEEIGFTEKCTYFIQSSMHYEGTGGDIMAVGGWGCSIDQPRINPKKCKEYLGREMLKPSKTPHAIWPEMTVHFRDDCTYEWVRGDEYVPAKDCR